MTDVNRIYQGDCIEVMKTWPENFVDTIITDPPYGLDFMGKDWDGDVPGEPFWKEMLRVCKPGALLLSFGGTRTWHHLANAIEHAGWEIRDCMMWLYGSGFPKSLDISKAIDKAKGAEREVVGQAKRTGKAEGTYGAMAGDNLLTAPATDLAKQWSGWGTALKPAWEPIIVAMKPLDGTFAENAEKWGVAGINVDGGRVEGQPRMTHSDGSRTSGKGMWTEENRGGLKAVECKVPSGRWPANLLLDEDAAAMLDGQSGVSSSAMRLSEDKDTPASTFSLGRSGVTPRGVSDSGGASRFFYVAKAARAERNEGCDELPKRASGMVSENSGQHITRRDGDAPGPAANHHPTVKPLKLMGYLCLLTKTPTGGIVLDPFAGSGTTLLAAEVHNRPWIGIEMNPEYVAIANARIARERAQIKMGI